MKPGLALLAGVVSSALPAHAVMLSGDGHGQALIYPYYSVKDTGNGVLNTYVSLTNATTSGKAIRVRFREARNGRETASFNLFLSANDMWTGALVPDGTNTRLITTDASCTDPAFGPAAPGGASSGLPFSNAAYSGTNDDGAGAGLDRTREGFLEVLEMATLTGPVFAGITQGTNGAPANCAIVRAAIPAGALVSPNGGLRGTATIINVTDGTQFSTAATALKGLTRAPFYRPASDPYPAFTAAEVEPASVVATSKATYRDLWIRGIDAVSAVLMGNPSGEFVLDASVNGFTDAVLTYPTRHEYVTATTATPPFTGRSSMQCGNEGPLVRVAEREGFNNTWDAFQDFTGFIVYPLCASVNATAIVNRVGAHRTIFNSVTNNERFILDTFQNGSLTWSFPSGTMTSLPASSAMDTATGAVTVGAHTFAGRPIVGFMATTITNGFLQCGTSVCRGVYGNAIPFSFQRTISP